MCNCTLSFFHNVTMNTNVAMKKQFIAMKKAKRDCTITAIFTKMMTSFNVEKLK